MDFSRVNFQGFRPLLREITADKLNTMLAEIRRNKPKGERGITVRQDGNGTYIGLAAALPRGGTPTTRQPWDLIARQDPDNETQYLVKVQPGTLNGFLPTNWDEEFELADTGLHYAKAVVSTDGVGITSVSISIDTTPAALQEPTAWGVPTTVDKLFGLFSAGSVYRVIGSGGISLSSAVRLTTPTDSPAQPGELPFINYYALQ
jgi:hypothetical protein